ncbi:aminoglycoside phosphotransferase family protein [Segetibacter sp. 3557_3]|uniref:phosphotransferase enzyme family protein n=1 Tax=Segetibacter sp. 3557_3 TaxID=2547429 RepID=UPI001058C999|nr:aminoglycoside phosphotransferase family protein [Segetibacter sp. 3557_3]TDH24249.1 aminoglycoside phosphotransferase family protein [Segetibacter sp. 3557_3]
MLENIVRRYGLDPRKLAICPFGSGLINHTWKIADSEQAYILQKINNAVFKNPDDIAENISLVSAFLGQTHPGYLFPGPLATLDGKQMVYDEVEGYFRLFPFVHGSHTIDVVQSPQQAYEAARQFGRFTRCLNGFDEQLLKPTIASFHDLKFRHGQFLQAIAGGNQVRVKFAEELIESLSNHDGIVSQFETLKLNREFKLRVMHHDTKISNVLFDEHEKGICVIDLDTIMPGYFISDVGDMMRTYLSPANEEETNLDKIVIREDIYRAIVEGYCVEMQSVLTQTEKKHFFYAGCFMIYMQALRFLSDYLENDQYYGCKYDRHNYDRASNQFNLLEKFMLKKDLFENMDI